MAEAVIAANITYPQARYTLFRCRLRGVSGLFGALLVVGSAGVVGNSAVPITNTLAYVPAQLSLRL